MQIKLYPDEDAMDSDLVNALRLRGIDVLTALEAGMIERPNQDHLLFAALNEKELYSFNVADFAALHSQFLAEGKTHSGIVLAQQQRLSIGEKMRRNLHLV